MQANLGGSPTRLDWTKAFLRAKEKERGPLDFDVPGGADTTWQRIYLCLRSGFDAEALEVRRCEPCYCSVEQKYLNVYHVGLCCSHASCSLRQLLCILRSMGS